MKRGFTLIEVIITMAVIALLAVSAYPSFNALLHQQDRQADLGLLEACFQEAQARAKAPSDPAVTKISLVYSQSNSNCTVSEVGISAPVSNTSTLAGKDYYYLQFPKNNNGSNSDARLDMATDPPYLVTYQNSNSNSELVINVLQKITNINLNTLTINLNFGAVNSN